MAMNANIFLFLTGIMAIGQVAKPSQAFSDHNRVILAFSELSHLTGDTKSLMDQVTSLPFEQYFEKLVEDVKQNPLANPELLIRNDIPELCHQVGEDLRDHMPVDFRGNLDEYEFYPNKQFTEIFYHLNQKWLEISKVSVDLGSHYSTLINTEMPFFVPGGRFREFYYWDSYWILKGLLRMGMEESAANIIKNMIFMIDRYGFVPNGSRLYYTGRTQPPLFTQMIYLLYSHNPERHGDFVLNIALKEYEWLEANRKIEFHVGDELVSLSQYRVHSEHPRFESFKEDLNTFKKLKERFADASESEFYSHIHSAAESGWDFSTRWLEEDDSLYTIHTTDFVPVDLNAFLYRNEMILSKLLELSGERDRSVGFRLKGAQRAESMKKALWNNEKLIWNDYDMKNRKFNDKRFYFSNITPLICGVEPPSGVDPVDILLEYSRELFGYIGGIPAGGNLETESKEQWDFPNAWAPHQSMMVDYLVEKNHRKLAIHVAQSFFENVREEFKTTKVFCEKYRCNALGLAGTGGEYEPQIGFGWTNGSIIDFLFEFHKDFAESFDHGRSYQDALEYLTANSSPESKQDPLLIGNVK